MQEADTPLTDSKQLDTAEAAAVPSTELNDDAAAAECESTAEPMVQDDRLTPTNSPPLHPWLQVMAPYIGCTAHHVVCTATVRVQALTIGIGQ